MDESFSITLNNIDLEKDRVIFHSGLALRGLIVKFPSRSLYTQSILCRMMVCCFL